MSWLSKATGVHISPHGAHLSKPDPLGAVSDAVHNPIFDTALAIGLPGVGSAITGALGAIPGIGGALSAGASAIGGAASGLGGGIAHAVEGIPGVGGLVSKIGSEVGEHGGVGGLLKSGLSFLGGNGGQNLLGAAQGVDSVLQQRKADDYGKQALNTATGAYNAKSGLRSAGIEGMLHPTPSATSGAMPLAGNFAPAMPTAGPLAQFAAPAKPQATAVSDLLAKDKGNPYGSAYAGAA